MNKPTQKALVGVRMDEALKDELKQYAQQENRTLSNYVENIIVKAVADMKTNQTHTD